jgi:GT2 family glycosyltransferase
MKLSVIIPAYNCLPAVIACVNALMATTDHTTTEILIQDDASPEYDGPALLGSLCQRNAVNLGFNRNCVAGAARANGEVLMFLNQDCVALTPSWDALLLATFDALPEVGIIGPTLLFPDGRIQSVGGIFDAFRQPSHFALGFSNPDWELFKTPRAVSWITGAAFAVRRTLWDQLDGFDPAYSPSYFEDADFCVRANLAGFRTLHQPAIRFTHSVGSTGGSPSLRRNARLFRQRWVETGIIQPDVQAVREGFWR